MHEARQREELSIARVARLADVDARWLAKLERGSIATPTPATCTDWPRCSGSRPSACSPLPSTEKASRAGRTCGPSTTFPREPSNSCKRILSY